MSTDSSNNDPFVSVVIPCFNEAGNIQELYEQLKPVITEYS
ncbi:MAG: glycosyltransferase involved in cell wall biosynthesis, partial [Bacteroidia bacterium]